MFLSFDVIIGVIATNKRSRIISKGGGNIISGIWCDFDGIGYIQNNMDTMNQIYMLEL